MARPIDRWLLAVAASCAVGAPVILLQEGERPAVVPAPVAVVYPAPLRNDPAEMAAIDRTLFKAAPEVSPIAVAVASQTAEPGGRPELIGIVGRLPDDAVALVRGDNGRSETIRAGQSFRGWKLASLGSDAALFVRGSERIRVGLDPVG